MTEHTPEIALTKAERETLLNALWDDGCHGFGSDHTHWPVAVEGIIAARLDAVETVLIENRRGTTNQMWLWDKVFDALRNSPEVQR